MLSWRRGAGTICLPTPSIYISLSFSFTCGWWLQLQSHSTAIRNANVSHLVPSVSHSRVAVAWVGMGLPPPVIRFPVKLKSENICGKNTRNILVYSPNQILLDILFPHFPNGPGVMAALSTQARPWAGLGPHVPA